METALPNKNGQYKAKAVCFFPYSSTQQLLSTYYMPWGYRKEKLSLNGNKKKKDRKFLVEMGLNIWTS